MYSMLKRIRKTNKSLNIYLLVLVLAMSSFFQQGLTEGLEENILYAGTMGSTGKVLKIDLNTFQIVGKMTLRSGENAHALELTNQYLYVGSLTAPAKIIQIRLSDFTRVNEITLPSGFNYVISLHVFGSYLYAGIGSGKVVRINPSTLTIIDAVNTANTGVRDTVQVGDYLYVVSYPYPYKTLAETVSILQKLRISDLSEVARIQLSLKTAHFFKVISNYLYIASCYIPAGIMKIDLNTFREVASVQFTTGDGKGSADVVVQYGDYLLTNGDSRPGRIYRTRLSDFKWLDYIDLSMDRASDLEISGKYLYVSNVLSPSSIIKVDLDTFQEIAKINTGEGPAPQMVVSKGEAPPPPQQQWRLSIGSNLTSGVPVTIDGSTVGNTPVSVAVSTGTHTVSVPSNVGNYNFLRWEDGSTNPTRTINVLANMTLTAYYKTASTPPPPPSTTEFITITGIVTEEKIGKTIIGALVRADGYLNTTDSAGRYALMVPSGIYTVRASAPGYKEASQIVDARIKGIYRINLTLVTSDTLGYPFPVNELIAAAIVSVFVISIVVWFISKRRKPLKSS